MQTTENVTVTGLTVDVEGDADNRECDTVTGLTVDVEGDADNRECDTVTGLTVDVEGDADNRECDTVTGLTVDVEGDADNRECDTVTGLTVDVEGDVAGLGVPRLSLPPRRTHARSVVVIAGKSSPESHGLALLVSVSLPSTTQRHRVDWWPTPSDVTGETEQVTGVQGVACCVARNSRGVYGCI